MAFIKNTVVKFNISEEKQKMLASFIICQEQYEVFQAGKY